VVGEYDQGGNPIQEIIWFNDQPVATIKGPNIYYIHSDHLNTPRAITDNNNKVVWRWGSDPFGTTPANEDPDGDGTGFTYNLRFPGQYYDQESGLHYNYFRDYDPSTGRYVESDPIGLQGGLNTYFYANANPLKYYDEDGWVPKATDKTYGMSRDFWNWHHRQIKKPGDPDLSKKQAKDLFEEWKKSGKPNAEGTRRDKGKGKRLRPRVPKAGFCPTLVIPDLMQNLCAMGVEGACFPFRTTPQDLEM